MVHSPPLILAIGDSLVAGYGLAQNDSFPARLEVGLQPSHPGAQVVNAGVSGATTGDVLRRMPSVLSRLNARPALAIVQVGPNDVLRRVPPAQTRNNLAAIVLELKRCSVRTLLTTVEPPAFLREQTRAYADLHRQVAEEHGAATLLFFPQDVLGRSDMVLWDRVHPNARAIAAVVKTMLPTVTRLLNETDARRPTDYATT
jgi:acyl-CoA thioesterase I